MPRRIHCPYCSTPDEPAIFDAPHRAGIECLNASGPEVNAPIYEGPRDDEDRPIGVAVKSGKRVAPKIQGQPTTPSPTVPPPSQPVSPPPSVPSRPSPQPKPQPATPKSESE
jgi:hypothetical protein